MPAGQVAQVFRDNLGIDLVEQVRQQNDQRTFPAPLLELHERPIIPRLDRFGEHIVNRMHQPPDPPWAAARGNVGAGAVGKSQEPDLVVANQGDVAAGAWRSAHGPGATVRLRCRRPSSARNRFRSSKIGDPVTSDGIRSGVN